MKNKNKFTTPIWGVTGAKVVCNNDDKLGILFSGIIPSKKNSRNWVRGISLPSANYMEWHKRCEAGVKDIKFKFDDFPCSLSIYSIIHNNVKKDLDNYTQSIQDFLTDMGAIPDDNNMVISEIHTMVIARIKNCPLTYVTLTPLGYDIKEYKEDIKYSPEGMKEKTEVLLDY